MIQDSSNQFNNIEVSLKEPSKQGGKRDSLLSNSVFIPEVKTGKVERIPDKAMSNRSCSTPMTHTSNRS